MPLLVDFDHEVAQKIFSGETRNHLLVFLSHGADAYADQKEVASTLAKDYKGKVPFVSINTDEGDKRILEFLDMEEDEVHSLWLIRLEEDMARYKLRTEALGWTTASSSSRGGGSLLIRSMECST